MKKVPVLATFLLMVSSLTAQFVNYNDVAVIINDNSPESIEIGNYFQQQRNIPDINMIHIQCSTDEHVDSLELFSIVHQIGDYLLLQEIKDEINYLVTTKGVPITFEKGSCDSLGPLNHCTSIDSELTLVVNHEDIIGPNNTGFNNPFYNRNDYEFSQTKYGIYLVTRLDGYTVEDVKALIDKSGPDRPVFREMSQFIFDLAFAQDSSAIWPLVSALEDGNNMVQSMGWNTIFSPYPSQFVTDETDVLGYYSFIYQPSNKELNNKWLPGSLAAMGMGGGAATFTKEENEYNDLIMANFVEEGVSGISGYVTIYVYFPGWTILPEILFEKYLYGLDMAIETNPYYNLAESYYQAIKPLSSVHVIVGDPKTSILIKSASAVPEFNTISNLNIYPNPANTNLHIQFQLEKNEEVIVKIYNIYGSLVLRKELPKTIGKQITEMDVSHLVKGMYIVEIASTNQKMRKKILIE